MSKIKWWIEYGDGDINGTSRVGRNAIPDLIVFGRIAGANGSAEK